LGSTGDGIQEYDEALLVDGIRRQIFSFNDEPESVREAFAAGLMHLPGLHNGDPTAVSPLMGARDVIARFLGDATDTVLLDAACASSLYALDLAARQLWNHSSDVILAGGFFSPGPANNALFCQFRGSATVDAFPFDERADGVIFGEGAAVLALKRLPDAIAAGDRIYGVIRGAGVSSDGKSPSANVPRAGGQALAVKRAYASCGIDPKTIQFVEAHATSTPVGDATEFDALRSAFGDREGLPPIYLESIKALIGHTGWVAGAASVIKVCRALEERLVPPQYQFNTPGPGIQLAASPFTIPVAACPWPANASSLPRRAGVSGFGFGGTNAHVILEAFDPAYHQRLASRIARSPTHVTMAVIGIGGQFAAEDGDVVSDLPPASGGAPFARTALHLPAKRRLLPDALEHLDVTQFLALMGAERALAAIPDWAAHRKGIGMALGVVGKTPRGASTSERIYLDRLRRLITEHRTEFKLEVADFDRIANKLFDAITHDNLPTNPYTLVGMMPNVATGRVANMFDLNGANLVVDAGALSLLEALRQAELWLAYGDVEVVLAGGLEVAARHHPARPRANVAAGVDGVGAEGVCVAALTTPELANQHGWPVLAHVTVGPPGSDVVTIVPPEGALAKTEPSESVLERTGARSRGVAEMALAMDAARRGSATTLRWAAVEQPAKEVRPSPAAKAALRRPSRAYRPSVAVRPSAAFRARGAFRASGAFPPHESPRRSSSFTGPLSDFADLVIPEGGVAFTFPGQGSYDGRLLRELYDYLPHYESYFEQADEVAQRHFGESFLALARATSADEHDASLARCHDLDQLGIFLNGVLIADALHEKGIRPAVLMGHSFGELAALAVAGAFDVETGLEIVAQRVLALRSVPVELGGMLALSCPPERARELLAALGVGAVTLAVVNHPRQSVLSGPDGELKRIEAEAPKHALSATRLESRYPFHSPLLAPAAERFGAALRELTFSVPRVQVYSPIERAPYAPQADLAHTLASHLVRPLDFRAAVTAVRDAGCELFLECGAGEVLTRLVQRNLPGADPAVAKSVFAAGQRLATGVMALGADRGRRPVRRASVSMASPSAAATRSKRASQSVSSTRADTTPCPIAVVGMGCIVPGARDVNEFWNNLLEGVSGIVRMEEILPEAADFLARGDVVADKTYTMLWGYAGDIVRDARMPYSAEEFDGLVRAQQLLANAMAQCLGGLKPHSARTRCLLGASAEGIREYDEAVFIKRLQHLVSQLDEAEPLRTAFAKGLADLPDYESGDPDRLATFVCLRDLVEQFLGAGTELVLSDVACASSLYAIEIAIRQLRNQESDLIVTGGVFSPGPLLQPLFAQFKGLASTGCYPFDQRADGVIFGEGAAVLALKRLPDALAAGDRIYGVIRGAGVSSDGKSPSANVPRASGQALAMRRAYESAGLDHRTVQMIEAHATSTPVGDATEFQALGLAFGDREGLPPINLQSIKALIGHTGWVAGAASVIKVCRALEERLIPPQYQFETPGTGIELSGSPFTITVEATRWPANVDHLPRRAGVSGFGFGGTNAHVVVEAFEPAYHERLATQIAPEPERSSLAVVGVGGLFPSNGGDALSDLPPVTPSPLRRAALRLPAKTRLLPDAVEHMDVSQFLTVMAAEKALQRIPEWTPSKEKIGVVLGLTGKTPRAIAAIERVFLDNLRRNLERSQAIFGLDESDFTRIKEKLCDILASSNPPSNPYTMLGMLPNLAAGRVANLFDLSGPNLVMDAGNFSLLEVLRAAERWLAGGSADVMLAGALHTDVQRHPWREAAAASTAMGASHEGACLLALTTTEMARERGWPVLAHISVGALGNDTVTLHSAEQATAADGAAIRETQIPAGGYEVVGLAELARAVDVAAHGGAATLRWQHATAPAPTPPPTAANPARVGPVGFYTPVLVPAPALAAETAALPRMLFLAMGAAEWKRLAAAADLDMGRHQVVTPDSDPVPNGMSVDLTSDETIRRSLVTIDLDRFDAIVCVRGLRDVPAKALLADAPGRDALAELLFAVSRQAYERISSGSLAVASLNLGAFTGDRLHPETGVYAGFIKSLARELPDATIKCVNTDAVALTPALNQLITELGTGTAKPWEVFYRGGHRLTHKLLPLPSATRDHRPYIDQTSVVIATGGGRGVTAVMVEELLERFHCTVIVFGRTDPSRFPQQLLEMDEAALKAHEAQFYREATAREPGKKMAEHKRAYERLQAAHEIHATMRRLGSLPGRVAYQPVDVTDAGAVNQAIKGVTDSYGGVDFVVHGAGVQTSVLLPKRKLTDWRRTLDAKLAGLRNIHAACAEHARGPVHYHLLTSAFSYYGNDGQHDYGAANEAMNRLVECLDASDGGAHWTALAWLAWAGVGMTRGSEFEVLAEKLGVYPLPSDEGQRIFGLLLSGRATAPCNVLLTECEQPRYKVAIATPDEIASDAGSPEPRVVRAWTLSLETAPYLAEHVVSGTPTLPGAFEVELAAEAARELRPQRHVTALENAGFVRFVRVSADRGLGFRAEAAVIHEDADETVIHVRLLSDFVHKSGVVLQKDIVHFEVDVRLRAAVSPLRGPCENVPAVEGRHVADPYVGPASPVRLNGMFECLHDIVIGSEHRVARFRLGESKNLASIEHFLTPAVLIDAMLRFGAIMPDEVTGASPVAVPERGGSIALQPGVNDAALQAMAGDVVIVASHPRMEGDQIVSEWVQAFDANGRPLIVMQQGVGRVMEGLRIRA
jgi:acyl transferase domain-containing protein/NAD(P)-dependent dehydrogenase (short-subunit alcohol dehydrogenase family)